LSRLFEDKKLMTDYVGDTFFIRVLGSRYIGLTTTILVGRLIALDAEINSLILQAKWDEDLPWLDLTEPYSAISDRYRGAWKRFESLEPPSYRVHHGQIPLQAAFTEAIAELTALKERSTNPCN
jgi:hypothetical protein